jgi:hypothetical protein
MLSSESVSPYIVLNRSMIEAMPIEWQLGLENLIDEFKEVFEGLPGKSSGFAVTAKDQQDRFMRDPYLGYSIPNPAIRTAARKYYGVKYDDPADVRAPAP